MESLYRYYLLISSFKIIDKTWKIVMATEPLAKGINLTYKSKNINNRSSELEFEEEKWKGRKGHS